MPISPLSMSEIESMCTHSDAVINVVNFDLSKHEIRIVGSEASCLLKVRSSPTGWSNRGVVN